LEAVLKAPLIAAVLGRPNATGHAHAELVQRSELWRSAVTGILSGSLQKVTVDFVLRLVEALAWTPRSRSGAPLAEGQSKLW
jgi:hypothetical protein